MALVLFWHGGAGELLADCASAKAADNGYFLGAGKAFAFLVEVHSAVTSGRVRRGALSFDPRDDDGCDWTGGMAPDDFAYPVELRCSRRSAESDGVYLFTAPVAGVANTRIFARRDHDGRQHGRRSRAARSAPSAYASTDDL